MKTYKVKVNFEYTTVALGPQDAVDKAITHVYQEFTPGDPEIVVEEVGDGTHDTGRKS